MPVRVVTYEGPKAKGSLVNEFQVEVGEKASDRHTLRLNDPQKFEADVADAIAEIAEAEGQNVTVETVDAHEKRIAAGADDDSGDES